MDKENKVEEKPGSLASGKKTRKSLGRRVSFARTNQIRHFDVEFNHESVGGNAPQNLLLTPHKADSEKTLKATETEEADDATKDGISFHIPNLTSRRISTAFNFHFENRRHSNVTLADNDSRLSHDSIGLGLGASDVAGVSLKAALDTLKDTTLSTRSFGDSFLVSSQKSPGSDMMEIAESDTGRIEELTGRYSDIPQPPELAKDMQSSPVKSSDTTNLSSTIADAIASPQAINRLLDEVDLANQSISTIAAPDNFLDDDSDNLDANDIEVTATMTVDMDITTSLGKIITTEPTLDDSSRAAGKDRDAELDDSNESIDSWQSFFAICNVDVPANEALVSSNLILPCLTSDKAYVLEENCAVLSSIIEHIESKCAELESKVAGEMAGANHPASDAVLVGEYELGSVAEKSNIRGLVGATQVACLALAHSELANYHIGVLEQTEQFVSSVYEELESDSTKSSHRLEAFKEMQEQFAQSKVFWEAESSTQSARLMQSEKEERGATMELDSLKQKMDHELAELTAELDKLHALEEQMRADISALNGSRTRNLEIIKQYEQELLQHDASFGTHSDLNDFIDKVNLYRLLFNYNVIQYSSEKIEWLYDSRHSIYMTANLAPGKLSLKPRSWNLQLRQKPLKCSVAVKNASRLQALYLCELPVKEFGSKLSHPGAFLYKYPLYVDAFEALLGDLVSQQLTHKIISNIDVDFGGGHLFQITLTFFSYQKRLSFSLKVAFNSWEYPTSFTKDKATLSVTPIFGELDCEAFGTEMRIACKSFLEIVSFVKEKAM